MAEQEIDLIKLIRLQLTIFWHVTFPECYCFFSRRIISDLMKISFNGHVFAFCSQRNYFPFYHLMADRNRNNKKSESKLF